MTIDVYYMLFIAFRVSGPTVNCQDRRVIDA